MDKRRIVLAVAFCAAVAAWPVGRWVRQTGLRETPTQRAHRLCSECGLDDDEIDRLMDDLGDPALTRAQALAVFFGTFENPAAAKPCLPCAQAVLDAAFMESEGTLGGP